MDRATLQIYLTMAKRHILEGERHLTRQREIVARLERAGRGESEAAHVARGLLTSLEGMQLIHLAHRDRLSRAVAEKPADLRGERKPQPVARH
jgi:hypothetical protein